MNINNNTPINKTAAIVTQKGFEYVSLKKIQTTESKNPIKIKKIPHGVAGQSSFIDLTGFRYARMLVVGMYADGGGWVVRCSCGTYCVRTAKAVKNTENTQDRCEECRHLAYLKRDERRRRTGKDVDIRQF